MRRINIVKYLGCSELLRPVLLPQIASEWSIVCFPFLSYVVFFYLNIVSVTVAVKLQSRVLYFWLEHSFALEEAFLFVLTIQTNFPPELPIPLSLPAPKHSVFTRLAVCPGWLIVMAPGAFRQACAAESSYLVMSAHLMFY